MYIYLYIYMMREKKSYIWADNGQIRNRTPTGSTLLLQGNVARGSESDVQQEQDLSLYKEYCLSTLGDT